MADTSNARPAIDPGAQYEVTLSRALRFSGMLLSPRNSNDLRGDGLKAILDDAETADAVVSYVRKPSAEDK